MRPFIPPGIKGLKEAKKELADKAKQISKLKQDFRLETTTISDYHKKKTCEEENNNNTKSWVEYQ